MKIIKGGSVKIKEKKKKCSKCKTEFSFTNSDVKMDRDGDYVNCPVCDSFISAK